MAVVAEYGTVTTTLTREDLAYLLPMVRGASRESAEKRVLQAVTPTARAGEYELHAGPYVGRLGLPSGSWIDFRSRFPIRDVFQLILDAERLPVRVDELPVDSETWDFFVDALVVAFLRETERLTKSGLAKGYRVVRHTRPPYGGRLDMSYHLARFAGRPDRLVTTSRTITTDIEPNRVLALALDVLRQVRLPDAFARGPDRLAPVFARVSRAPATPEAARRVADEAPLRYRRALSLAALVLASQALVPRGSQFKGASMLFFMPAVWEAYVTRWVERERPGCRVQSQYAFELSEGGLVAIADTVAWGGERSDELVGLYDAKYKWPDAAPVRGDLYQMATYCDVLHIDAATLVYPVEAPRRTVRVGNKSIDVLGLTPHALTMSAQAGAPATENQS